MQLLCQIVNYIEISPYTSKINLFKTINIYCFCFKLQHVLLFKTFSKILLNNLLIYLHQIIRHVLKFEAELRYHLQVSVDF